MTPRDLKNIHTTGDSCRDALACADKALKITLAFLPVDGEASWVLLSEEPMVLF